jgi:ubiquinone/menaquinone biosynthesis C-methylase UbiE
MMSKEEGLARTAKVFNTASDYFDDPALSFWNRYGQNTINRLALSQGDRVLDVCCGSGASAIPAAVSVGSTGSVLGVDIAESLLELARHKSQKQGLRNIEFRCGDFENLNLPSESFFVPDMLAAVRELWRMVRPGGKLAITSWGENVFEPANQAFWQIIKSERPELYKEYTPWDRIREPNMLKELLAEAGATEIEVVAIADMHELSSPEDWWTIVMGGGIRGTIEQLDLAAKERVRQASLQFLRDHAVHALDVSVLYAVAQK